MKSSVERIVEAADVHWDNGDRCYRPRTPPRTCTSLGQEPVGKLHGHLGNAKQTPR